MGLLERLRRRLRHAASPDPLEPKSGLTPDGYTVISLPVALHTLEVLVLALERAGRRDGTIPAGTALPLSAAWSVVQSAKTQGVEW